VVEINEEKIKKDFAVLSKHKQHLVLYRVLLQRYAKHRTIKFDRRSEYDVAMLKVLSFESMFLRSKNTRTLDYTHILDLELSFVRNRIRFYIDRTLDRVRTHDRDDNLARFFDHNLDLVRFLDRDRDHYFALANDRDIDRDIDLARELLHDRDIDIDLNIDLALDHDLIYKEIERVMRTSEEESKMSFLYVDGLSVQGLEENPFLNFLYNDKLDTHYVDKFYEALSVLDSKILEQEDVTVLNAWMQAYLET